ncbi:MAG: DUF998 domain-containing protein, partial [Thermoplasmata archaeon]|nr:DUF998 domain-containing protein [Thermoplasmata archaeon]
MSAIPAGAARNRGGVSVERISWVGLVGTTFFVLAVVALHFLRPDYNPAARFISEFAVGPYGLLMTIAFFALGLAAVATAFGIHKTLSPSWTGRIGTALLGVFALGVFLAGIFPTDVQGGPMTTTGAIHVGVSLVSFVTVIVGMFVNARAFARDPRWKSYARVSAILGVATVVAFIGLLASFGSAWVGAGQRIFVGVFLIWLLLTAARLRS